MSVAGIAALVFSTPRHGHGATGRGLCGSRHHGQWYGVCHPLVSGPCREHGGARPLQCRIYDDHDLWRYDICGYGDRLFPPALGHRADGGGDEPLCKSPDRGLAADDFALIGGIDGRAPGAVAPVV